MSNIHASYYKPRYFPIKGNVEPAEIDRAQSIDPSITTNREEVNEIGRDGVVGYISASSDVSYDLTQLEYGSVEFYQLLAGSSVKGNNGEDAITLNDFKNTYGDAVAYLTDDDGNFKGTVHYPSLRLASLNLSIPGPEDIMERSFTFEGEDAFIWQGNNKYYIYAKHTAGSGSDNEVDLSARTPVQDPIDSSYMYRVAKIDAGTGETTELTDSQYSYDDGTEVLTIDASIVDTGDIFKIYYTSSSAPAVQFTENDTDAVGLLGDSVSIYLYVPASGSPSSDDYIYRLQSCDITADLEREDLMELGNDQVVQRGISDKNVTVDIERTVEDFTIEEVLSGRAADFGKITAQSFSDEIVLIVKVFESSSKNNFNYGIKCTGLTPSDIGGGADVQEYINRSATLTGKNLSITKDTSVLGI